MVNTFGFTWPYSSPLFPSPSSCPRVSLFEQWTWWGKVSPAKCTQWTSSFHRSLRGCSRQHCSALKKKSREVDWALSCQQPLGEVSEVRRFHLSSRYCPTTLSSNWWHMCTPNPLHIYCSPILQAPDVRQVKEKHQIWAPYCIRVMGGLAEADLAVSRHGFCYLDLQNLSKASAALCKSSSPEECGYLKKSLIHNLHLFLGCWHGKDLAQIFLLTLFKSF